MTFEQLTKENWSIIEQLSTNVSFLEAINNAESKNEFQQVFSAYGIDLSHEEVDGLIVLLDRATNGELGEGDLENVAGGGPEALLPVIEKAWPVIKKIAPYCWSFGRKLYNWMN